jgi:hypothetical protein
VTWNAKAKRIFVVDLFRKSSTARSALYLRTPTRAANARHRTQQKPDFLFKKIGRFDCF